jgi:hypothetical protein
MKDKKEGNGIEEMSLSNITEYIEGCSEEELEQAKRELCKVLDKAIDRHSSILKKREADQCAEQWAALVRNGWAEVGATVHLKEPLQYTAEFVFNPPYPAGTPLEVVGVVPPIDEQETSGEIWVRIPELTLNSDILSATTRHIVCFETRSALYCFATKPPSLSAVLQFPEIEPETEFLN